ncbi:hypothetical protein GCM10010112_87170 [Actinoplanes lobatus]|uniref:Uncharacterized protein n=1 Tax=Actinoplanes lobatus TaxID=113568 RepID=A0A7W7HC02_9ACTN|nr:hypothetical protein [Actinoplanes lobatus]MBB4747748.1 hypothetical protein [Actinoplanes lobatus]GGN96173.1 hypothetical protein GCM10010112_87170 [Actinoplanes lobatus]GIE45181.1 hypothetical protein Alo02nite_80790 [Actinoplanes lobatus]
MPTGILVLTNCLIELGGTTGLASKASKLEMPIESDELDVTVFGGVWKRRTGGLLDGKVNAGFFNDYTGGDLDEKMWNWVIGRVPIPFAVQPDAGAVGPSNPRWTGFVFPKGYSAIAADVGGVNKFDISWATSGAIARATS